MAGLSEINNRILISVLFSVFIYGSLFNLGLTEAASAGPKNPTAVTGDWTNPDNALTSNSTYATYNSTERSYLTLSEFAFTIPAGSTINGIEVLVKGFCSNAANRTVEVSLTKAGTAIGTQKNQLMTGTDNTYTLGTASDLWGVTWLNTDINSSTFGVMVRDLDATASGCNIDYLSVTVTYTPNNPIVHNSVSIGSGKWGANGWGIAGGKYGEFVCETCHTRITPNIKRVNTSVTAPDPAPSNFPGTGQAIVFNSAKNGVSDFGDDTSAHATSTKVCEVCHTYDAGSANGVKYHAYDMSAGSADTTHNNNTDCIGCHLHTEGFKPSCRVCHGFPPIDSGTMVSNPSLTGSATAGAHAKHASSSGMSYPCDTCHFSGMPITPVTGNNKIQIGFNLFSGAYSAAGTTYRGQSLINGYSYEFTNGTAQGATTYRCTNIYCHGRTPSGTVWGGGSNTTPLWNSAVSCGDCHAATAASPPLRGSHYEHTKQYLEGYNYSCSLCHKDPQTDSSLHANNKSEVIFSSDPKTVGGTYNGTDIMLDSYGTCTDVYCHSTVQSSPPGSSPTYRLTPTWGGSISSCGACHDYGTNLSTGSHAKHMEYEDLQECYQCHNWSNSDDSCLACHDSESLAPRRDKHVNRSVDIAFAPKYGGAYSGTAAPGDAYGSCANTYCHGATMSGGSNTTPTWGGTAPCGSCHAATSLTLTSGSHTTHLTALRGPNGVMDTTVTCDTCHGAGAANGTHAGHVNGTVSFADGDTIAATTACNTCHSPGGSYDGVNDAAIGAKTNWSSGVYNVNSLNPGKERWCSGCHDNAPSNSKADNTGVNAKTVTGDNSTYGYYATGHGKGEQVQCTNCHDSSRRHIDHQEVALSDVLTTYDINPTTYRFYSGKGMELPFNGEMMDSDFALCYSCHDKSWISDNTTPGPNLETNFRMDANVYGNGLYNLHRLHINGFPATCVQCHDPHGTVRPAMASEFIAGFRPLTYSAANGKYFELTDRTLFSDPAYNHGGALTQPATSCAMVCHGSVNITNGVGPVEGIWDGWYLRLYKSHAYTVNTDYDADGFPDTTDNCVAVANPSQSDSDNDGIGDVCDNCPSTYNPDQTDKDLDGIGNACDASCDAAEIVWTIQINGQTTGNEEAYASTVDAAGNVYVAGYTYYDLFGPHIGNNADAFIAKYDSGGVLQWGRHFGTTYRDYAQAIAVDSGGSVYVVGYTNGDLFAPNGSGPGTLWGDDYFVAKYDQNGNFAWGRQYSSTVNPDSLDRAFAAAVDAAGNVYVTGNTSFLKYDSSGNLLNTVAGGCYQDGTGLAVDNINGFIYRSGGFSYNLQLTKYDLTLNQVWTRSSGTTADELPYGVAVDGSGNIYMTGFTAGSLSGPSSGGNDIVIVKYNSAGTLQWTRQIGTSGDDSGIGIGVSDSALYVSANTSGSFVPYQNYSGANPVLFKFALNGNKLWHTQWNAISMTTVKGLATDTAGYSYLPGGGSGAYVMKVRQCQ